MVEKLEKNITNIRRKNMKTVIVTGGSRGIGKWIAENLAKEGYNVVLNYKMN